VAQLSQNGKTAFVSRFERQQAQTREDDTNDKHWLASSVVQERSLDDRGILFEWRAAEHVSESESFLPPGRGQDNREYDFL
jgi:hypothetical protein